jgi:hypothetical protein
MIIQSNSTANLTSVKGERDSRRIRSLLSRASNVKLKNNVYVKPQFTNSIKRVVNVMNGKQICIECREISKKYVGLNGSKFKAQGLNDKYVHFPECSQKGRF